MQQEAPDGLMRVKPHRFPAPRTWIAATQSDAKREPHGHDPIAVTDARTTLDKVQLEATHPSAVAVSGERLTQVVNLWQL
jgi:hypothetical protein